ncbi:MAG: FAD-dependent oxidoreductase [Candidatus Pacearchaeota archaeon]
MRQGTKKKESEYDIIIIGAGGAGLAAAMYAARLGLKTLVLGKSHGTEHPIGGVITTTHVVENYPGFIKISGYELAKKIEEHARSYDLVKILSEKAIQIKKRKNDFVVRTEEGNLYYGKTIVFATGTKWKKLSKDIKGSREFENKGISYCALCDGPLYKDMNVAVIGGSDSAAKDALLLSEYAKKVYIIYRGKRIHPEPINFERIKNKKNIEIINNANLVEICGNEKVEKIIIEIGDQGRRELEVQGVFVAIGHEALSNLAKKLGVEINEKGEIVINHKTSETNVKGVYAAGDVTDKPFKQLITGVAEGCVAAYSAYEYLKKRKFADMQ